jgi:hypothetical protein
MRDQPAQRSVRQRLEIVQRGPADPRSDEDLPDGHIHLSKAVIHIGSEEHRVGPWRGRLSKVDGWALNVPRVSHVYVS